MSKHTTTMYRFSQKLYDAIKIIQG